jgi:hypothetical protein
MAGTDIARVQLHQPGDKQHLFQKGHAKMGGRPLARGVAETLKPQLPRLGQKMRDLDLEPENEEYKALEATANLAQDPDGAAIDRAIELEIGQLPDDERDCETRWRRTPR